MRALVISAAITRRDDDALGRYFHEIEKKTVVSVTEEEQLCRRIANGDKVALSQLVTANLRFVISVAKQYQTRGISLSDLISEGNIGLIRAAERFDHTKGFRFITYAVWYIRQAVVSAIEQQTRFIHLPLNQVSLINKYMQALSKLEQSSGCGASVGEISAVLGIEEQSLSELLIQSQAITSLDRPLVSDSAITLCDLVPQDDECPDAALLRESVKIEVEEALKTLPRREREVLTLHFGLGGNNPKRLEEIAEIFKLSVEHTRRIKDKALEKLRLSSAGPALKSCLS
ncbi:RNA polymerase sigma factor RpoD/SigA [Mucilaginibacter sp. cycad4]|uniref:sigma-70 family RNA polymerase sigma factor n=1 Tax=Mucilaginibacter sp. cycad4 TaxID=3342096 RepID=UPI002AAAF01A|nr:RNA polymerase sigma factor RpoD/SigA [Mucilaginibacter gossypii]WPU99122.1 RNA polymerase sigma factor RpoD/SigA [Mucilaginibacter gossypii]